MDSWRHGKTNKQRDFIGIIVNQVDPHRETLNDFDEIAGRILWRKQGERRTCAKGEARDTAFKGLFSAIHVSFDIHMLTDAQVTKLRFFEVGIDPRVVKRPYSHETLSDLNVVSGIDISSGNNAIDLGDDCAISQI